MNQLPATNPALRLTPACARAVLLALGLVAGGCAATDGPPGPIEPGVGGVGESAVLPGPSAVLASLQPERLRVHPLTRLERDAGGRLRLVCHVELADRFGHPTKWFGLVRVEVYRPGEAVGEVSGAAGAVGGGEQQSGMWSVDLTSPERNAEVFDWVTRTYRLELVGLPGWVEALEQGRSREPWCTVRAYFLALGADGRERRMEASFRLRRAPRPAE